MIRKLGLLAALITSIWLGLSAPAHAQENGAPVETAYCTPVYNGVAEVSLDSSELFNQMNSLRDLGYTPHVVLLNQITTLGRPAQSDADEAFLQQGAYEFTESLVALCPELQVNGIKDPNMILLAIGHGERYTYINWGENLNEWLGTFENPKGFAYDVRDAINAEFRRGDFAGGAAAGFEDIENKITYVNPISRLPWTGIFMTIGVLTVLGLLTWGVMVLIRRRRERRAYEQEIAELVDGVRSLHLTLLEQLSEPGEIFTADLHLSISVMARRVSASEIEPIQADFDEARTRLNAVAMSELERFQRSVLDGSVIDGDDLPFTQLEKRANDMRDELSGIAELVRRVESNLEHLRTQITEVGLLATSTTETREKVVENMTTIRAAGFFTTAFEADLKKADTHIGRAVTAEREKRISQAHSEFSLAVSILQAISLETGRLQQRRDDLLARQATLESMLETRRAQVEAGKADAARLDAEYNPDTWRTVAGNGQLSEALLGDVAQNLKLIQSQLSMESQEFDQAEVNLDQVETWLSEVDSYMRSRASLLHDLDEIRDTIREQLGDVKQELAETIGYVREHNVTLRRANVDEAINELLLQQDVIDQIEQGLAEPQPHYLDLAAELNELDTYLDKLTEDLEEVYDRVRSTERRLKTMRSSAKTRLDRVEEYIEDHDRDVDEDARRTLETARRSFNDGSSYSNGMSLAQMVILLQLLEDADKTAADAQSMAERDYRSAQSARDAAAAAARRRSSSSSSSGSYGRIGGGGGGSFGSFGGGIGGGFSSSGGGVGGSW